MNIRIDRPDNLEIYARLFDVRGWCTVSPSESGRLRFEIGGLPLLFVPVPRPDVEAAYPDEIVQGFVLHLDLTYYMRAIRDCALELKIIAGDGQESEVRFKISSAALGSCMSAACGL
jgi:hypothetical protein